MKLLSRDDLKANKGICYSRVQLWRLERAGKFPKRVRLGGGNRHGWLESEIDAWLAAAVAARDAQPGRGVIPFFPTT